MARNSVLVYLGFAATLAVAGLVPAEDSLAPRHLELARTLLSNVSSGDTSYTHRGRIKWEGDPLVLRYEAHTDCSGLINDILNRAQSPSIDRLNAMGTHPKAKDYYNLISRQDGFTRIDSLSEVLPGDIIAVKYLPGHAPPNDIGTGHVMLVDESPVPRDADTQPLVAGTRQWEVTVIDSSKSPHGKHDSRQKGEGSKRNGLGRGIVRLYANEHKQLMGYSWSTARFSSFYDASTRPVIIGRPILKTP